MRNPKFNAASLLALTFVMWILAGLLWWVSLSQSRHGYELIVPIVLTIFAVCATGMYLNETK